MGRESKTQFAINAASGVLAQVSFAAVGFILLPYVIGSLGPPAYGIYELARSMLASLILLQMGMGPTLVRYIAQAIANRETDALGRISSTAQFILCPLGLAGMALVMIVVPAFLSFYQVPEELTSETTGLLMCMAVSLLVSFVSLVPAGLVLGSNRYDLANGLEIVTNLVRLGLVLAAFEFLGPSLFLLGTTIAASQIFRLAMLFMFSWQLTGRAAVFSPRLVHRTTFRSMFRFSSLALVTALACYVVLQGPLLIIGRAMGNEAVALFAPAVLVASSMQGFLAQMSRPLVPMASEALANSDGAKLSRLAMLVGRLVACVGLGMVLPLCVFGHDLIGFWLGPEMAWTWSSIAIMAIGTVMLMTASANHNLAIGGGDILPSVQSYVVLGIVVSSGVAAGAALLGWGLFNIALYIALCQSLRSVFYMTWAYSRQFKYSSVKYLVHVYLKPLIVFLLAAGCGWLWNLFNSVDRPIPVLFGEITGLLALYAILVWFWLLPESITSTLQTYSTFRRARGNGSRRPKESRNHSYHRMNV